MVSFSVEGVLTKIVVLDMYKALSIQKIRQKYKNADITKDTLLSQSKSCNILPNSIRYRDGLYS
jgi:hypothetical protein